MFFIIRIKKKKSTKHNHLNEEEKKILEHISQQTDKYFQKDHKLANDFSIMFRNFGEFNKSIDYILENDDGVGRDWQLLDLYLIARQHINLLSHCEMMKSKYSDQPNALFSISYDEALGYWELGERNKAIQLMSQIASMKPDFKSASEILIEWREESID